jgi:hypothetical protein
MYSFGIIVRSRQRLDSPVLLRASAAMAAGAVEAETGLSSRCTGSMAPTRTSSVTTQERGKSAGNIIFQFPPSILLSFYYPIGPSYGHKAGICDHNAACVCVCMSLFLRFNFCSWSIFIKLGMNVVPLEDINQFADFHTAWYECCATGGHPNLVPSNLV